MTQEEFTSETVTKGVADWLSTVLSVPLIWPKTTALASVSVTVLAVGLVALQLSRPAGRPRPTLDRARIAEIEAHVRAADSLAHSQMSAAPEHASSEYKGYMHAVGDSDHAEHNHEPSRVHAH